MELRQYQIEALDNIKKVYEQGIKRQLIVAATGTGKSAIIANIKNKLGLKGRTFVFVHREEIIRQLAKHFKQWNPSASIGIEMADEFCSDHEDIVICSVQSVGRNDSIRLNKFKLEDFGLLITDECFVKGTLVDGKPIDEIMPGDYITSYDEEKETFIASKVVSFFSNVAPQTLVKITVNNKNIVCTKNHPFFTKRGWITAENLTSEDYLLNGTFIQNTYRKNLYNLWERFFRKNTTQILQFFKNKSYILFRGMQRNLLKNSSKKTIFSTPNKIQPKIFFRKNEEEQPIFSPRNTSKSISNITKNTPQTSNSGRKWETYSNSTKDVSGFMWARNGICSQNKSLEKRYRKISNSIQNRFGQTRDFVRDRSRWWFSSCFVKKTTRQEKRSISKWIRLDNIEILQQGSSAEYTKLCPNNRVYNLEIENTNTYLVNGFVVHNCHHGSAQTYKNVFEYFKVDKPNNSNILSAGFTATPNRADGQGLGAVYDKISFEYPITRAITDGWLVDIKSFSVRTRSDLNNVTYRAGDFALDELSAAVNTDNRNLMVVNGWKQHGEDRQTICFATNIAHAQALAKMFKDANIAAEAVWGDDPNREYKLKKYINEEIKVLVNINIFTEGFDNPETSCILMARPTTSSLLFTQAIGRGLRLQDGTGNLLEAKANGNLPNKLDCVILDITDNCEKHKLISTSSLFGFPSKLDFNGKTIADVEKKFKEIQDIHPTINFDNLTSFEELNTYIKQVNLFDTKLPNELLNISKLHWIKQNENYLLPLTSKQKAVISKNLLDEYYLLISLNGNKPPVIENFKFLDDAIFYAEKYLKNNLPYMERVLVSENHKIINKMTKQPATDKQKNYIKKLGGNVTGLDTLDKAKAMQIIQKLLAEK